MNATAAPASRQQLRQRMRQQRRALSPLARRQAAWRLAQRLSQQPAIQQATRVGLYIGHDGELDPWRFSSLWRGKKRLYLPVLYQDRSARLHFVAAGNYWRHNRFGIPEPRFQGKHCCPLWRLDVLLLPLTAFDSQGGRLGMGGGFYDRTLAQLPSWGQRPVCFGIGYRFQQQDTLPLARWDQPLDGVITD